MNGDRVTITSVQVNVLSDIVNTWTVSVVNATQFTVPFDSSAYGG